MILIISIIIFYFDICRLTISQSPNSWQETKKYISWSRNLKKEIPRDSTCNSSVKCLIIQFSDQFYCTFKKHQHLFRLFGIIKQGYNRNRGNRISSEPTIYKFITYVPQLTTWTKIRRFLIKLLNRPYNRLIKIEFILLWISFKRKQRPFQRENLVKLWK